MSDILAETETFPMNTWCPECGGPPLNEQAVVMYCQIHMPVSHGDSDRLVDSTNYLSGGGEAGGVDNRLMCAFFHRDRKETRS